MKAILEGAPRLTAGDETCEFTSHGEGGRVPPFIEQMPALFKNDEKIILIVFCLLFTQVAFGLDCAKCGKKDIPELAMVCPYCQSDLYLPEIVPMSLSKASLIIELVYTGGNPERLPDYGKVYINRKYEGNIPLVERESPEKVQEGLEPKPLGENFSALYRLEMPDLMEGVYEVTIKMRFHRLLGILRSERRLTFPQVSVKTGNKTVLRHFFASPRWFNRKKAPSALSPADDKPSLTIATGTIGVEIPITR